MQYIVFVLHFILNKEGDCIKVVERYKALKEKYPKYVILIKIGNFYEIYGEEAYIVHNLFNYKIRKDKDYIRVGFPIIAGTKVFEKLKKFKINFFIVIDKEKEKVRFNKNNYDNYLSNLSIEERIQTIEEKLAVLKNTKKIDDILNKIEAIL